jgi:hypothetical protein
MLERFRVLALVSFGLITILADSSLPGLAQDKSACQAYFQVVQRDARIAGGFIAGGNEAQKKWWEKQGKKNYPGLCWDGSVLSVDKPRYLLIWLAENHSELVPTTSSETSTQPVTGTVTDTYGQPAGSIEGTATTRTTSHGFAEKNWTTVSISIVKISPEGTLELPAIYFKTVGASFLESQSPIRWSSDGQKALEGALKFLSGKH